MDFVSSFIKVKGMPSVFVRVDQFSKYAMFSETPHASSAEIASDLFFKNVMKQWECR